MSLNTPQGKRAIGIGLLAAALAFWLEGTPGFISPLLFTASFVFLGMLVAAEGQPLIWYGIVISALSLFVIPTLQAIASFTSAPGSGVSALLAGIVFAIFVAGNLLMGLAINRAGLFRAHTGTLLALTAILVLVTGFSLPYALAVAWMGGQLMRQPKPTG